MNVVVVCCWVSARGRVSHCAALGIVLLQHGAMHRGHDPMLLYTN
jgi:hypothetical protein